MAKTVVKKRNIHVAKKVKTGSPFNIYWDRKNYILLFSGAVILILGFYMLSVGEWDSTVSIVFGPILLAAAYLLIFPFAIFASRKKAVETVTVEENPEKPA